MPDNRLKLLDILARYGLTQANAAYLICEYTRRPCSIRTVRSWINDPSKPSSRTCPDWVLIALIEALKAKGINPIANDKKHS